MKINISDKNVRMAVYEAYDGKCFYTNQIVEFDEMHIDHILPKSKGGKDEFSNFALSSPCVNLQKNDRLIEDELIGVLYFVKIHYLPKMVNNFKKLQSTEKQKPVKVIGKNYIGMNLQLDKFDTPIYFGATYNGSSGLRLKDKSKIENKINSILLDKSDLQSAIEKITVPLIGDVITFEVKIHESF